MNVSMTIKKLGIEQAFKYLYKEPEKNLVRLMDWADKFSKGDLRRSAGWCARRLKIRTMSIIPISVIWSMMWIMMS